MSRTLKQLTFGSVYFVILALVALGVYLLYFKPAPSCADNKQNQSEIGVDCGSSCIPCEVKGLNIVTEEIKIFPTGKSQITLLAKVRNPSQNFSASFSYKFNLGGTLAGQRELRGRETLAPQKIQYIVVPNLPIDEERIAGVSLDISELNWSENKLPVLNIRVNSQSDVNKNRVTVTGVLSNNSAANLPTVRLTALLFDKEGKILNASIAELGKVEAFSERQFIVFFPEVEGLAENVDPQKTEIQWELDDESS
ncbi:MAG: FxLYD domain-containing protein [bacterium]|nr:FxLYD domain-containing protein [bacterium]